MNLILMYLKSEFVKSICCCIWIKIVDDFLYIGNLILNLVYFVFYLIFIFFFFCMCVFVFDFNDVNYYFFYEIGIKIGEIY